MPGNEKIKIHQRNPAQNIPDNIVIIGGGPAGMTAANFAAHTGKTILIEKNEKLGKKLYLTGKGRCNLTNATDMDGLLATIRPKTAARFLYGAFTRFTSADTIEFFEEHGVPVVIERGRRAFPASGHASDVTKALENGLRSGGARVLLNRKVLAVQTENGEISGVVTDHGYIPAGAVIVATGGLSYPSTGSTGDGYRFAKKTGHAVTPTFPSLVPLITAESWPGALAGLSLKNIRVSVFIDDDHKKPVYAETGEMLFTHNGVSGPLVLSASRYITGCFPHRKVEMRIDLKPALSPEKLAERLNRDFLENKNKNFANALDGLLPQRMIAPVIALCGIPPGQKVNGITREERLRVCQVLKGIPVTPAASAGYAEAVVTAGGVDVREINPSTMMSKKVPGLFFAGEVLDADAATGGFNLQIAFSTGYLAGVSAAEWVGR